MNVIKKMFVAAAVAATPAAALADGSIAAYNSTLGAGTYASSLKSSGLGSTNFGNANNARIVNIFTQTGGNVLGAAPAANRIGNGDITLFGSPTVGPAAAASGTNSLLLSTSAGNLSYTYTRSTVDTWGNNNFGGIVPK